MNLRDIEQRLKELEKQQARGSRIVRLAGDSGGGGGDAAIVQFELVTVDCDSGTATGTPLKTTCDGDLPSGDQDIIDDSDSQCYLTGNEQLLIGKTCWCVYTTGGPYGCAYAILSMCCNDSEC